MHAPSSAFPDYFIVDRRLTSIEFPVWVWTLTTSSMMLSTWRSIQQSWFLPRPFLLVLLKSLKCALCSRGENVVVMLIFNEVSVWRILITLKLHRVWRCQHWTLKHTCLMVMYKQNRIFSLPWLPYDFDDAHLKSNLLSLLTEIMWQLFYSNFVLSDITHIAAILTLSAVCSCFTTQLMFQHTKIYIFSWFQPAIQFPFVNRWFPPRQLFRLLHLFWSSGY